MRFDGILGTNLSNQINDLGLTRQSDGLWIVDTPPYDQGDATVTITWTINGIAQPDDSTNTFHYTYIKLGNLPQAGGNGILLLLLSGLILMTFTLIAHRYARRSSSQCSSHTSFQA